MGVFVVIKFFIDDFFFFFISDGFVFCLIFFVVKSYVDSSIEVVMKVFF